MYVDEGPLRRPGGGAHDAPTARAACASSGVTTQPRSRCSCRPATSTSRRARRPHRAARRRSRPTATTSSARWPRRLERADAAPATARGRRPAPAAGSDGCDDHPVDGRPRSAPTACGPPRRPTASAARSTSCASACAGRSQSLARDFDRVLRILEAWGYVDGWSLTDAGERPGRACSTSATCSIAECLRQGLLDDLDAAALAGLVVGVHLRAPQPRAAAAAVVPVGRRSRKRWQADRGARPTSCSERRGGGRPAACTGRPTRRSSPSPTPGPPGRASPTVVEDEELSGGDFVRNIKQLIDLLRQLGAGRARAGHPAAAPAGRRAAVPRGRRRVEQRRRRGRGRRDAVDTLPASATAGSIGRDRSGRASRGATSARCRRRRRGARTTPRLAPWSTRPARRRRRCRPSGCCGGDLCRTSAGAGRRAGCARRRRDAAGRPRCRCGRRPASTGSSPTWWPAGRGGGARWWRR